ncbi:MAG: GatB/YqeY domain-containing protein [Candidatus Daviesbacteria bacterium]|nr:MAG: GatB/YqeY domain-containing protein [Candidatus Daviesbacteria bacterium]
MDLFAKLQADLKQAQLNREKLVTSTLRLVLSEIHNSEIQTGQSLSQAEIVTIIAREAKKRTEAAEAFKKGGRAEAAEKEEAELKVLQAYLPEQLSTEELTKIVKETITEVGATSISDMAKVMSAVMGKVGGKTDGATVSTIVKENLHG